MRTITIDGEEYVRKKDIIGELIYICSHSHFDEEEIGKYILSTYMNTMFGEPGDLRWIFALLSLRA
jgi:hypothetical protein